MHIHIGLMTAANVFMMVLLLGFFWRVLSHMWADKPIGQAMAFIY